MITSSLQSQEINQKEVRPKYMLGILFTKTGYVTGGICDEIIII